MRKLDLKLIALCVILPLQFLLVVFYILSTPTALEYYTSTSPHNVRFLESKDFVISRPTYRITLNEAFVDSHYTIYNGIACYTHGTDIKYMVQTPKKCVCKKGWHSQDCGQPEVIWRAFVTSRQEISPTKRKTLRRIIYVCPISYIGIHNMLVETIFHELDDVVDLFIVYQTNSSLKDTSLFPKQLLKKSYHPVRHKIVYISLHLEHLLSNLWHSTNGLITNLRQDDLIVMMNSDKVPNSKALFYFKLYDGWPQPVGFRLRWSVYGFFWQHPKLTSTAFRAAFTLQFLDDVMRHESNQVNNDLAETQTQLIVGDLNHYGGWFCSWCLEPKDIITSLRASAIGWDQIRNKKFDILHIQDLIGTGLWLDGITVLLSKIHHKDKYFAPNYILNNSWQYDSLLTNLYAYDYN